MTSKNYSYYSFLASFFSFFFFNKTRLTTVAQFFIFLFVLVKSSFFGYANETEPSLFTTAVNTAEVTSNVVTLTTGPSHNKYVVGYYAQWAIYARDFNVSDIRAENLTHLMYAFYDTLFDENTDTSAIESLDDYADYGHTEDPGVSFSSDLQGNLGALKVLREENPHLKVLISLGGWTKSMNFPALARSDMGRQTLAQAMVDFINTYPFIDGFDNDWEFPVEGGIDGQPHFPDDHKNLVLLLKEMRISQWG